MGNRPNPLILPSVLFDPRKKENRRIRDRDSRPIAMKALSFLLLPLAIGPLNADICVSKDFGFTATFPQNHQKTEVKSPQGPMANFSSVDRDKYVVSTVSAQRTLSLNEPKNKLVDDEQIKRYISLSLSQIVKIQGSSEVQSSWEKGTAWPVLKVSFKSKGFFGEDVPHYESGYWFLIGDTFYRVISKGLKSDGLDDAATRLYGSFMLPDAATLENVD